MSENKHDEFDWDAFLEADLEKMVNETYERTLNDLRERYGF